MTGSLATAPDTVLDVVFAYCDYAQLFACSHTSRTWRRRTAPSITWRRVAQADLERARGTEYQIVATPVHKRAGLASSFNTSHLYAVEVRTRHHQRGRNADDSEGGAGGDGSHYSTTVPSYAQNLQQYTFGAGPTSAIASTVSRAYGGGGGEELERNPSSTCFTTLGSTAKVRRVCMRYIQPLRFTAGEAVADAVHASNAKSILAASSADFDGDGESAVLSLPLWEDGSIVRPGVLLCDTADPCTFCYYAATLHRPWCTVLMDDCLVDDDLLVDFIDSSRDASSSSGGASAATCFDLAFRVEELPIVRNDPRNPSRLVEPAQPVSIRIGVVEASQLDAYRRGVQHVVHAMTFYAPRDAEPAAAAAADRASTDDEDALNCAIAAPTHDSVWGALDSGMRSATHRGEANPYQTCRGGGGAGGGVSWSYTGGGARNTGDVEADSAAAAEAEVAAWLQASVQESAQSSQGGRIAASARDATPSLQFWSQELAATHYDDPHACRTSTSSRRAAQHKAVSDDDDGGVGAAFVLGDTPGSFGYDTEGGFISEASSYPLGAPLQHGDVVHLQFFHDEDVIVVTRNRERLGTIVADAFSEQQRWCVAVSLQNCGVRFIPPRLN